MKVTVLYRLLSFVLVCMLTMQAQVTYAQWAADVVGTVKKEEDKKRMAGATITILKDGAAWKTVPVDAKGNFKVALTPDAVYMIEISKYLHVTKRIEVSTKNVPPEEAKMGIEVNFDVSLFEKVEGMDVSILDKPIGRFAYNPDAGYIVSDGNYAKTVRTQLDILKKDLEMRIKAEAENRKNNQKTYDAAIVAGDKAFKAENYAAAKPFYEKAAKIFPSETYPEFQLGDIMDRLKTAEAANSRYASTIVKADEAFKAREWEMATSAYEHAAYLKAKEQYPKDKIKEIKDIVSNEKKVEKEYNELMASADQLLIDKVFEKAKVDYEKASVLKDYEQLPKDKIKEIEGLLAEIAKNEAAEKAKEAEYNGFIAAADKFLGNKDYDGAKGKYNEAITVKPDEQYPKDKLTEISGILADITKKEEEEKLKEDEYNGLITEADNLLSNKEYETAKEKYNAAISVKSKEKYPKEKITEIEGVLAELAKNEAAEKAKEEEYNGLIAGADNLLASKDYNAAKSKYTEALGIKADEKHPKDKIAEIEGVLAEIAKNEAEDKAKEEEYSALITAADKLLDDKDFESAKGKYNAALGLKADEKYPKERIAEIEGILAELAKNKAAEKVKEEEYNGFIAAADKLLGNKDYDGAKGKYNEAIVVKPDEKYPKEKLTEIDGILAENAKQEADKKAKDKLYQNLIIEGDNLLANKSYDDAKGKYKEAIEIKSTIQYPKDKLKEIETALAEIARKKAEEDAAQLAEGERDAKYKKTIALADAALTSEKFEDAKSKYNEALGIKSGEQYPKDKLTEIEGLLAEIARKKAEADAENMAAAEKDKKYDALIKIADDAFNTTSYESAKGKYNEALAIKSDEKYPKDKLKEIETALADLSKKNEEDALAAESERKKREYFDALIAEADGELDDKNYDEAKSKYNQALGVIPNEQYPTTKLKEIGGIIAKLKSNNENDALAKKQLEESYNKLLQEGDAALSAKKYDEAKPKYTEALSLKNNESYPKTKLAEIESLLAEIAAKESEIQLKNNNQEQTLKEYNSLVESADNLLGTENYIQAQSEYNNALELMPNEFYPKGKIKEIDNILADLAAKEKAKGANAIAEKEKRGRYDKLVYDADRLMKLKDYDVAKSKYNGALKLYSSEQYPKNKIAEIIELLKVKPEKEIIVSNVKTGNRSTISGDNEKEIERRMAILMGKEIVKKDVKLAKEKFEYNHQEKNRVDGGIERTIAANKALEIYVVQNKETAKKQEIISEEKSKFHYEYVDELAESKSEMKERGEAHREGNIKVIEKITSDTEKRERKNKRAKKEREMDVLDYKKKVAEQEGIRIEGGIERTTAADEALDIYIVQQKKSAKKQKKRSEKKSKDHYEYVDEIDESKTEMKERGEAHREVNIKEIKKIASATEKRERKNKRAKKKRELNVLEYKKRVAKQEEIRVDGGIERTTESDEDIKTYREQIRKESVRQDKKYYADVNKDDYLKEGYVILEREDIDAAEIRRETNYDDINTFREKLGEVNVAQKIRYKGFQEKLNKEKDINKIFYEDLQKIEENETLLASSALNDVYQGEDKPSVDVELSKKYDQGITEETLEGENSITIRRTKVTGDHVDVYERVFYNWGGNYFYKNGKNITQTLWDSESID